MRTLTTDVHALDQRDWRTTLAAGVPVRQPQPWTTTLTVAALAQVALLIVLIRLTNLGPVGALAALGYTGAVCAGLAVGVRRTGADSLGPADKVTLARSTLVGCVTALVADTVVHAAPLVLLVTLTLVALALDGVDGWVARRTGTASALGARFDMEVDAFLILVLSVDVAMHFGAWVLAIGLMRYVYVTAGAALAWLREPVPPTVAAKVVAVVQGVVLVVAVAHVLPSGVVTVSLAVGLAALVWSFGRSVRWLYQTQVSPVFARRAV